MNHLSMDQRVCIVSTGGTFEKMYDPASENLAFSGESVVPTIMTACGIENIEFRQLMQVDSSAITEDERDAILHYLLSLEFRRVVIIHGTSSVLETARLLYNRKVKGVYIFTGAMVPYRYSQTEAAFNLGGAIALSRCVDRGVFLYMHGEIFKPLRAKKDRARARFVHSESSEV